MTDFKVEFASNDTNFDAKFGEVQTVNPGATPDPGTAEQIKQAVADYLNENPVQAGATEEEAAQIAQNKADIEKLNADKLDASALPNAINDALAQAKESGEFDGEPGYTPVKGKDYYTEADKAEMVSAVIAALPVYNGEVVEE